MRQKSLVMITSFVLLLGVLIPQAFAVININEFLPAPQNGNPEWVEFYNNDLASEDLSNYYFDDDTNFDSDTGTSGKVALSGLLSANLTCFIEFSTFLNNNGDIPTLFKLDGTIADTYQYASSSADKSYARIADGGAWQINQTPTKSSLKCSDLAPSPTPTLTPSPTSTSTPTRVPSPTQAPIATSTLTPTLTPIATIGISQTPTQTPAPILPTDTPAPTEKILGVETTVVKEKNARPIIFSLLLVASGFGLLSGVLAWKKFTDLTKIPE